MVVSLGSRLGAEQWGHTEPNGEQRSGEGSSVLGGSVVLRAKPELQDHE